MRLRRLNIQCKDYKVVWCTIQLKRLKNDKNMVYKIFNNLLELKFIKLEKNINFK